MRTEREEPDRTGLDRADENGRRDDVDESTGSAKTRAGSNLPNAAGNRDDGTHE